MANEYKGVSCILPLRFEASQDALTAGGPTSNTVAMTISAEGAAIDGDAITMPFDGAIVGIAIEIEGMNAGESISAQPTIDAVEIGGNVTTVVGVAGLHAYATFMPDAYPVARGEVVGAEIYSTTGVTTTDPADTVVTVFVQIGGSGT